MAASFFASFLIFILTGIYSLYNGLKFTEDFAVKMFVSLVLLVNAIFYHYVAAYTEIDSSMKVSLKDAGPLEWVLRVVNQCILLSLWFWLDHGWRKFGTALIALYVSFLLWDALTWKYFKSHKLFWVDCIGMILSVLYVLGGEVVLDPPSMQGGEVVLDPPSMQGGDVRTFYLFFGASLVLYLILPILGIMLLKFNPMKKEYWIRPGRH